jgi:hypothetical protein
MTAAVRIQTLSEAQSLMWIMPVLLVVSLLVAYLVGWCFRPPTQDQLTALYCGTATTDME